MKSVPTAMTIAGSDSGAGAGIQADLKAFAAMDVYGTSVLTAITAQNTLGVTDVFELPASIIGSQIDAVVTDIGADAVKTGMLSSTAVIDCVVGKLREHNIQKLIVDPVMVAQAGSRLLREDAVDALRESLLPMALLVTPTGGRLRYSRIGLLPMLRARAAPRKSLSRWERSLPWSRASPRRTAYGRVLRRHRVCRVHHSADSDRQHARNRLHVCVGPLPPASRAGSRYAMR